jgi:hypothetical protein
MPARMQMLLSRPQAYMPQASFSQPAAKAMPSSAAAAAARPRSNRSSLLEPMISRVHKAKPGCSSCGKK